MLLDVTLTLLRSIEDSCTMKDAATIKDLDLNVIYTLFQTIFFENLFVYLYSAAPKSFTQVFRQSVGYAQQLLLYVFSSYFLLTRICS